MKKEISFCDYIKIFIKDSIIPFVISIMIIPIGYFLDKDFTSELITKNISNIFTQIYFFISCLYFYLLIKNSVDKKNYWCCSEENKEYISKLIYRFGTYLTPGILILILISLIHEDYNSLTIYALYFFSVLYSCLIIEFFNEIEKNLICRIITILIFLVFFIKVFIPGLILFSNFIQEIINSIFKISGY